MTPARLVVAAGSTALSRSRFRMVRDCRNRALTNGQACAKGAAAGVQGADQVGRLRTAILGMSTSRSALLRLVRALPDPPESPVVLGVDDLAIRRGQNHGTVLIDCQDGRVVDLLPGRNAAPLAAWLAEHAKPRVICRNRASAYAEGARTGAPDAVQVADRFHLWQNLAKAVERCVGRHEGCLRELVTTPAGDPLAEVGPSGAMAQRRREHHKLLHGLLAEGAGSRQFARHLGWGRHTVQRYVRAATWREMLVGQKPRPSSLDPFKHYLLRRISEGCRKATVLHREAAAWGSPAATASSALSSNSTAAARISVRWSHRRPSVR